MITLFNETFISCVFKGTSSFLRQYFVLITCPEVLLHHAGPKKVKYAFWLIAVSNHSLVFFLNSNRYYNLKKED